MTRAKSNKQVIRGLYRAADEGDLDGVANAYSPEYVDHDSSAARAGDASDYKNTIAALKAFSQAFPDTRHSIHDLVAEGDRVAVRVSAEGTHMGEIFGISPTGCRISNDSIVIYRLEDGMIVERWCRENLSSLEQIRAASRAKNGSRKT